MTYSYPWKRITGHEQGELLPGKGFSLAPPIDPLKEYLLRLGEESDDVFTVVRYSIVIEVPNKFRSECAPERKQPYRS